ncbi:50S ribosomal protein L13 [Candidatus Woesearchaeota archaeon]|nr:50S ribosomal protein L13 [Candidatus Woesearchaeota archaeon]
MIIDATNKILGRLATFAAKQALLGEKIEIVNCENAMITGNRKWLIKEYARKQQMGTPAKGPFIPKRPERFVKRTIRGMLPYKKDKGRKAFERVKCYIGIPEKLKGKEFENIEKANILKVPNLKYIKIEKICKEMGAKL